MTMKSQKLIIICTRLHCQDRNSKQRLGAQCSRFSAHLWYLHMHCLQVSYMIIVSLQCTGFMLFYVLSSSTIPWLGHEWKNLLRRKKIDGFILLLLESSLHVFWFFCSLFLQINFIVYYSCK